MRNWTYNGRTFAFYRRKQEMSVTMEDKIIRTDYSEIMQKNYIDYAMSVIVSRALPDVRDGLKPVQRRGFMTCTSLNALR